MLHAFSTGIIVNTIYTLMTGQNTRNKYCSFLKWGRGGTVAYNFLIGKLTMIVNDVYSVKPHFEHLHCSDTGGAATRGPYDSLQMSDIGLRSVYSEIGHSEGRDTRSASGGTLSLYNRNYRTTLIGRSSFTSSSSSSSSPSLRLLLLFFSPSSSSFSSPRF